MKADLKKLLTPALLETLAESHIDGWKARYFRKTKSQIKFDLQVNHDPSLEIELIEKQLGRKLSESEQDLVVKKFNKTVVNLFFTDNNI